MITSILISLIIVSFLFIAFLSLGNEDKSYPDYLKVLVLIFVFGGLCWGFDLLVLASKQEQEIRELKKELTNCNKFNTHLLTNE